MPETLLGLILGAYLSSAASPAQRAVTAAPQTPASSGLVVLKPASIMDSPNMIGGEAYRVLVPAGWRLDGRMIWRNNPTNPAAPYVRVYNPSSAEEIGALPNIPCAWSPVLAQLFPPGSLYLGSEVRPLITDPIQVIRTLVLPRYAPHLANARIVTQEALPELAALGDLKYPELKGQAQFRAGKVRLEYVEKGTPVEVDAYVLLGWMRLPVAGGYIIMWGPDEIRYSKAPKGKLEAQHGLFQAVSFSLRPNLQWFNHYQQLIQMLVQNQMNASNQAVELSRYLSRTNNQISASIRQSYENRQAAMDRINARWDRYIRGVEQYKNPYGYAPAELPSGYNEAWTNANGEYILSNSPNYNPNRGSNIEWRRMEKVP